MRLQGANTSVYLVDDSVISANSLGYYHARENRPQLYRVVHDWLKPGGTLGIFTCKHVKLGDTAEQLRGYLEDADLENVKIEDYSDVFRVVTARRPLEGSPDRIKQEVIQ